MPPVIQAATGEQPTTGLPHTPASARRGPAPGGAGRGAGTGTGPAGPGLPSGRPERGPHRPYLPLDAGARQSPLTGPAPASPAPAPAPARPLVAEGDVDDRQYPRPVGRQVARPGSEEPVRTPFPPLRAERTGSLALVSRRGSGPGGPRRC